VRGLMNEEYLRTKLNALERKLTELEDRIAQEEQESLMDEKRRIIENVHCRQEEVTDLLLKMIDSDEEVDITTVMSTLGLSDPELQYLVQELVDHNLLHYTSEGDADITEEGRNYIRFRDSIRSMGFID
jgi:predicted transcriptional regulator